jgi:hypothetical protein
VALRKRSSAPEIFSGEFVIFGFNTDVKFADTVYHVQSEARQLELLLQTQVFVKGRCIGKRATPYAQQADPSGLSEEHVHELLKDQHKHFVAAVREGRIEAEFPETEVKPSIAEAALGEKTPATSTAETSAPSTAPFSEMVAELAATVADKPVEPEFSLSAVGGVIGKGLSLVCSQPACTPDGGAVVVCVLVRDDAGAACGAQVTCRITSGKRPARYVYSNSGENGVADVRVSLQGLDLTNASLLIQASVEGKSASQKFRLRQA